MEYALCRTIPQFPMSSQVCCPDCSWCRRSCPPWRTGPWCPPGDPDDVNDDGEGDGLAIQLLFQDDYDNNDDDDDDDDDDFTQAVLLSQATWSEMSSSIARITHLIFHHDDNYDDVEDVGDYDNENNWCWFWSQWLYFAFGSWHPFQSLTLWARGTMSKRRMLKIDLVSITSESRWGKIKRLSRRRRKNWDRDISIIKRIKSHCAFVSCFYILGMHFYFKPETNCTVGLNNKGHYWGNPCSNLSLGGFGHHDNLEQAT